VDDLLDVISRASRKHLHIVVKPRIGEWNSQELSLSMTHRDLFSCSSELALKYDGARSGVLVLVHDGTEYAN
jgi:hypothetical protein